MKHTEGKWNIVKGLTNIWIQSDKDTTIARIDDILDREELSKANAKRIVSCVNACAGIDNLNIVEEAEEMLEELKHLLEVCQDAGILSIAWNNADKLINRIEGNQ